ncbi:hypothetical protein [Mucilaginibacter myungsuensis]|uniref:Lipoprotein n=1 Tax=Mucilaginibacter myungsuensis TaxID=649104 RepID=A0A929L1E3_9SPHI|nr:hypothetical protein [Mucilaginibacter myungsuensis]MBE9664363.1 hypothetical protein [Mucilaginibacter myungsuensis]MDN3597073.1 hypothetical protein [Mucilaginibacter myungsuensis]
MKAWFFLILALTMLGCDQNRSYSISKQELEKKGLKVLDVKEFTIVVLKHWAYIEARGIDSFVGDIKIGDSTYLSFDLSYHGYASSLVPSKSEYENDKQRYVSDTAVINAHNFDEYKENGYSIKIIWPKSTRKGMTGIYCKSESSSFDFQLSGDSLSLEDQTAALAAFKTIKFKRNDK